MTEPTNKSITENDLIGKKLEEMSFWGQNLSLTLQYDFDAPQVMLPDLMLIYSYGNRRWSNFSGHYFSSSLTLHWHPLELGETVQFEGMMFQIITARLHHFILSSSSPFCRKVDGDGIAFSIDADGVIYGTTMCSLGG